MEWSGPSLIYNFLLPSVVLFRNMFLPQTLSFFLSSLRCSTAEIDRGGILMNCLSSLFMSACLACSPNFVVEMLRFVSFYLFFMSCLRLIIVSAFVQVGIISLFLKIYTRFLCLCYFWFGCVCSNHPPNYSEVQASLSLANLANDYASDSVFF